ncbi:hypothetical protein D3C78_1279050 [compost metagenome]
MLSASVPLFRFKLDPATALSTPTVWVLPLRSKPARLARFSLLVRPRALSAPARSVPEFTLVSPL